ncbi:MAG: NAD(P)/FAD-dependent oxidoreductase [Bacteroidales bacterium]|nr:NAD(P)/FAD-dependent oxidoreductase [Bacteroidales bacterium]
MTEAEKRNFDIVIIGAGPGGIATALGLRSLISRFPGKIALIDKAIFPREKVCGDAVPFWVLRDLDLVCPGIHEKANNLLKPGRFKQTKLQVNSGSSLTYKWNGVGYMIPRFELDNFLLEEVKKIDGLTILENTSVKRIVRTDEGFSLRNSDREEILTARYVIGADGAPSTVVRSIRPGFQKMARSGSAIRGYFSDLNIQDPETSLVFYQKKYAPGYFWLFPLSSSRANVGFGMGNACRQRKRINLNEAFWHFINEEPELKEILSGGRLEGSLKGGMLPFSKGVESVIGKGYALVGDAANLNDPFSGDGIRNAVISGVFLGECLEANYEKSDLFSLELTGYQKKLSEKLHKSLRFRARLVRLASRLPFLLEMAIRLGNKKWMKSWIMKWI